MPLRLRESLPVATGGAASVLLYAPVGLRVARQGRRGAEGLAVSTWWLKVSGFTASVLYNQSNGYPIEQYSETLVLSLESAAVLALVSYYRGEEDGFDALLLAANGHTCLRRLSEQGV